MGKTVAVILAGGRGKRMDLLCHLRPKPALPFAGNLRVIDFSLSNCLHSGITNTAILVDYQRNYMIDYLSEWSKENSSAADISVIPPVSGSYAGTADAVFQNTPFFEKPSISQVLILAGDHVYRMDYRRMLAFHRQTQADITVGVIRVPIEEAYRFGTLLIDSKGQIQEFVEKSPRPISTLASMGIYIFDRNTLGAALREDADMVESQHDFGYSILPRLVNHRRVYAYEFHGYWQDIGTIEAYYHANMELLASSPRFSLDSNWPVLSDYNALPVPQNSQDGRILNSIISPGCVIHGRVENSVLSPGVKIKEEAVVRNSIIMSNTSVGYHSMVDDCILDEGVKIGKFCYIGFGRSLITDDSDISVIGKDVVVPDKTAIGRRCKVLPRVGLKQYAGDMVVSGSVISSGSRS